MLYNNVLINWFIVLVVCAIISTKYYIIFVFTIDAIYCIVLYIKANCTMTHNFCCDEFL